LSTLREGDRIYTNIAIHLKSGVGSFRSIDDKPALTLNLSRFASGQRFHGLSKLHLNNSVQDPSFLKEKISRELFEEAGVLVPRAGHAVVELNGRKLGLYVLLEGVTRQFLARQYRNTEGNVYDGYSYGDVTANLKVNSGKNRADRSGLLRLAEAVQEENPEIRGAKLRRALDVDQFLSFMAMEVVLGHHDGYSLDVNNYRVFHNLETDKMVFIPHGMDLMFQNPTAPIDAPMRGLVAMRVMEDAILHRRYLERAAELSSNVVQVSAITNRIYEVARRIEPLLVADSKESGARHSNEVAQIVQFFVRRSEFLHRPPSVRP
jgi:spore coat protein CotH